MEPPPKRQKTYRVESRDIYAQGQRWKRHNTDHSGRDHSNTALSTTRGQYSLWKDSQSAHKMRHGARSKGSREAPKEPRQLDVAVDVDTVVVDVQLNVEVDSDGATLAVILPSVPAVPQFPSDFAVPSVPAVPSVAPVSIPLPPAYPFTSLEQALPSPAPTAEQSSAPTNDVTGANFTSMPGSSVESSSAISTPSPSLSAQPSDGASSAVSTSEIPAPAPSTTVSTSLAQSSSAAEQSSLTFTGTYSSHNTTWAASSNVGGYQGGATGISGAPGGVATAGSDADAGATAQEHNEGPSTPRVVGGVVGGLAGFILILAIALAVLRRIKQKRRGGALQLGDNDTVDDESLAMTQRSNINGNKFMPPAAAALLTRFSGVSKETDISDATNERSFQRVSGRKLPSAFSPGMSMEEARDLQNMSSTSLYRDGQNPFSDTAAIGGTGPASPGGLSPALEKEMMMPSPARTAVVHHTPSHGLTAVGGPGAHLSGASTLSPPQSPRLPRTLGRSHPSFDGSRGSRFTEDV